MQSKTETILTAAVLTAVLSFPTVSQEIDYSSSSRMDSPVVSPETDISTGVDVNMEDPSTVTVEKHDLVYTVSETPYRRVEKIETPEATLKIKMSNQSSISVVSSPYGAYRKGIVKGRKFSKFNGANKTRLIQQMNNLEAMRSNYRDMARQKMLPDVELRITRSKTADDDERIQIDNDETESVNLAGWKLRNSDGDEYTFEDLEIPARGTAMVYTASRSELNITESEDKEYVYSTGTDWDSDSEEALLFNVEGLKVAEDTY